MMETLTDILAWWLACAVYSAPVVVVGYLLGDAPSGLIAAGLFWVAHAIRRSRS